MAVTWTVSHKERLVIAVARGPLAVPEIATYLEEVAAAGCMAYRKIFDLTHAQVSPHFQDSIEALRPVIARYALAGKMGPLAIVARTPESHQAAQRYLARAVAPRALALFPELHEARVWLDIADPAPEGGSGPATA